MLHAKSLNKSYNNLTILKDISLDVAESEVVSIVGSSGAGKSTLLHILATLENADSGTYTVNKKDVFALNKNQLASFRNEEIGFIFQFHYLLPEFSAFENVCMPGFIKGVQISKMKDRANMLLEFLGLKERKNHKPSEMSGGEQQRVAVARSLINEPSIIMADEPSGNLDSKNSKELHELFFRLRKEFNQTFIIVTHNDELAKLSDRVLTIKDGKFI